MLPANQLPDEAPNGRVGMMWERCLTVLLIALFAVAGCSKQPATAPRSGRDGPVTGHRPTVTHEDLTAAESDFLFLAEEQLVSRCMAQRGFRYVAVQPPKDDQVRSFPYGNDDVAWARQHGYGILGKQESRLDQFIRNHPNTRIVEQLSEADQIAYGRALTGDLRRQIYVTLPNGHRVSATTDGCVADVRRELYGDLHEWLRLEYSRQLVDKEAHDQVLADRRYLQALDAWRSCMQQRGYRFQDPGAARETVGSQQDATGQSSDRARLRSHEIAVAVADAECARATQLISVATELDGIHREQVSGELEGILIAYREQQARALQRARSLLRAP